jgi:hypothetical protein
VTGVTRLRAAARDTAKSSSAWVPGAQPGLKGDKPVLERPAVTWATALLVAVVLVRCGGDSSPSPSAPTTTLPGPPAPARARRCRHLRSHHAGGQRLEPGRPQTPPATGPGFVLEQAGRIRILGEGLLAPPSSTSSPASAPAANEASRPAFHPVCGDRPLLRQLHRQGGRHSHAEFGPPPVASRRSHHRSCCSSSSSPSSHNGGWPSATMACSTSGWAMGARRAIPRATARAWARCWASCCASTWTAAAPTACQPTTPS